MKIRCKNGLCDRLAMIFSYLAQARKSKEKLEVFWEIDQECNGHFYDIFKPVDSLFFVENMKNPDISGWEPCKDFDPQNFFIYQKLNLVEHIEKEVNDLSKKMEKYLAIQVRRTDKLSPSKAPNFIPISDQTYFEFIEKESKKYKIFVAADCESTQKIFKEKYNDRVFFSSEIKESKELRQTSLSVAAVDLFTCIKASIFFGTERSGFSRFIEQMRKYKRMTSL